MSNSLKEKLETMLSSHKFRSESEREALYKNLYSAMEKKLLRDGVDESKRQKSLLHLKNIIISVEHSYSAKSNDTLKAAETVQSPVPSIDRSEVDRKTKAPSRKNSYPVVVVSCLAALLLTGAGIYYLYPDSGLENEAPSSGSESLSGSQEYTVPIREKILETSFLTATRGRVQIENSPDTTAFALQSIVSENPESVRPILLNLGKTLRRDANRTGLVVVSADISSTSTTPINLQTGCFIDQLYACKNSSLTVGDRSIAHSFSFELPDKPVEEKDFYLSWSTAEEGNTPSNGFFPMVKIENLRVTIY